MKRKNMNITALMNSITFFFFSILLFKLYLTGEFTKYIAPKMSFYLVIAGYIFLLWSIYAFKDFLRFTKKSETWSATSKQKSYRWIFMTIPIALLLMPTTSLDIEDLSSDYLGRNIANQTDKNVTIGVGGQVSPEVENMTKPKQVEIIGFDRLNKTITVDSNNFYTWMVRLFQSMEDYEGYTITITGFVFNDDSSFKENEFLLARLVMSCCVSDMTPLGIVCRYDGEPLEKTKWYTVTGKIFIGEYKGGKEPQILIDSFVPAEPISEYIYTN